MQNNKWQNMSKLISVACEIRHR